MTCRASTIIGLLTLEQHDPRSDGIETECTQCSQPLILLTDFRTVLTWVTPFVIKEWP